MENDEMGNDEPIEPSEGSEERARRDVTAAIAYLDRHGPSGWRERVDLSRLDMMSWRWCVLGQAYEGVIHYPAAHGGAWGEALRLINGDLEQHPERVTFTSNAFADYDAEWRRQLS